MKDLMFYKHFVGVEDGEIRGEEPSDTPSLVDIKGYIPLAKQVERAILSGERLKAFRRGDFDVSDDFDGFVEPSPAHDPDIVPSVDYPAMADDLQTKLDKAALDASVPGEALAKPSEDESKQQTSVSASVSAPIASDTEA